MNKEQSERLLKAMTEIKPVTKDKVNPHFRNRYADINTMLEDVKPILHKHGFFILQPITDGNVISRIVDGKTGETVAESSLPLNLAATAQQKGSEITYYRRYTLQSLLGLEAEDDDANSASTKPAPAKKPVQTAEQFAAICKFIDEGKLTLDKAKAAYAFTDEQLKSLTEIYK